MANSNQNKPNIANYMMIKRADLYRAYGDWLTHPEQCRETKTFAQLCAVAQCTPKDIELFERVANFAASLKWIKEQIYSFNAIILFNQCHDAVDRMAEAYKEGRAELDFQRSRALQEAGLKHEQLYVVEGLSYNLNLIELDKLLKLKEISMERYLKGDDETELVKVDYVRVMTDYTRLQSKQHDLINESVMLEHEYVLKELGMDAIYFPPMHKKMVEDGFYAIKYVMNNRYIYANYKKLKTEEPDRVPNEREVATSKIPYNVKWLEDLLQADKITT